MSDFRLICQKMKSKIEKERLKAVVACRKEVAEESNRSIDNFCRENAITILHSILKEPGANDELIFEAAWALTNISSGKRRHILEVINQGSIDLFVSLINQKSDKISEPSIWALANIAGNSANERDLILNKGVVQVLINTVNRFGNNIKLLRPFSWFCCNLCRHKSEQYPVQAIVDLLPVMKKILSVHNDIAINANLTWALSYAIDNSKEIVDYIISHGFLSLINSNLLRSNEIVMPSIHVMGDIVAGSDYQTSAAINSGVIKSMKHLLSGSNTQIMEESCWLLSNICAGTEDQVMTVIKSKVILTVLKVLKNGCKMSKREAAWVIWNMIDRKNDAPKKYLLDNHIFKYLISQMKSKDTKLVMLILKSIQALLNISVSVNKLDEIKCTFDNNGGIDELYHLKDNSTCVDVRDLCVQLINKHCFEDECD